MKRLYLTVEGQTEAAFAMSVLTPHLANFSVFLTPPRFRACTNVVEVVFPRVECLTHGFSKRCRGTMRTSRDR